MFVLILFDFLQFYIAYTTLNKLLQFFINNNERRRRTLNRKEQLRHRAVSLRQHGFLVLATYASMNVKRTLVYT